MHTLRLLLAFHQAIEFFRVHLLDELLNGPVVGPVVRIAIRVCLASVLLEEYGDTRFEFLLVTLRHKATQQHLCQSA